MSSTTPRWARSSRLRALVTLSSARCRRTTTPRTVRVNQATSGPGSTACCPRAGAGTSCRSRTARRPRGNPVGQCTPESAGPAASAPACCSRRPATPRKPCGSGLRRRRRRVASAEPSCRAVSWAVSARSTSTGSQRCALAVAKPSRARARVGQPRPAQQCVQIRRQRRRGWDSRLRRHRRDGRGGCLQGRRSGRSLVTHPCRAGRASTFAQIVTVL